MKFIEPSFKIISEDFTRKVVLDRIERAARTCYKSEDKTTDGSAERLIGSLIKRGHEAMLEHAPNLSVRFICDRGITHELVRHRLFSFAQESTRYVQYGKDNQPMLFLIPSWITEKDRELLLSQEWVCDDIVNHTIEISSPTKSFLQSCINDEIAYLHLIQSGWTPQQARGVLPNAIKTEIVVTGNVREWRNFFKLRLDKSVHPQMRELTLPLFKNLNADIPEIWKDIADRFSIK